MFTSPKSKVSGVNSNADVEGLGVAGVEGVVGGLGGLEGVAGGLGVVGGAVPGRPLTGFDGVGTMVIKCRCDDGMSSRAHSSTLPTFARSLTPRTLPSATTSKVFTKGEASSRTCGRTRATVGGFGDGDSWP